MTLSTVYTEVQTLFSFRRRKGYQILTFLAWIAEWECSDEDTSGRKQQDLDFRVCLYDSHSGLGRSVDHEKKRNRSFFHIAYGERTLQRVGLTNEEGNFSAADPDFADDLDLYIRFEEWAWSERRDRARNRIQTAILKHSQDIAPVDSVFVFITNICHPTEAYCLISSLVLLLYYEELFMHQARDLCFRDKIS